MVIALVALGLFVLVGLVALDSLTARDTRRRLDAVEKRLQDLERKR